MRIPRAVPQKANRRETTVTTRLTMTWPGCHLVRRTPPLQRLLGRSTTFLPKASAQNCGTISIVTKVPRSGNQTSGRPWWRVCEAAIEGQQDRWSVAEARAGANPSAIDTSAIGDDCLGDAIAGLLNRALIWHREHPEQTPDVQDEQVEGRTECGKRYPPDEPSPTSEEPSPTPEEPSPTPDESTETTG